MTDFPTITGPQRVTVDHVPARYFEADSQGRVNSLALEISAVEGCNLSCRGCSHLSPILPVHATVLDPASVRVWLRDLAPSYHAECIRVLGGEPLLHPELAELLAVIRGSEVGDRIRLVTNGTLLGRIDVDVWRLIDELFISIYPDSALSDSELRRVRLEAEKFGVTVLMRKYDQFRESYSELGAEDPRLVQRIYSTCLIAHVWHCHTVADGRFFKCPQSAALPRIIERHNSDGLVIRDSDAFRAELIGYLNSDEPLGACGSCLGAVGRLFAHEQVRRSTWREPQRRTTEALLDSDFLEALELQPGMSNGCISREDFLIAPE